MEPPFRDTFTLTWPDCLERQLVYHATPLHYVPSILAEGKLIAKLIGTGQGVAPRATAARRDRMLGIAKYVHFGFELLSPLLRDKLARGYPHAVFVFPASAIARLPGASLLRYNTKAWKSRVALQPVSDDEGKLVIWRSRIGNRRLPSLEMLVPFAVDLRAATELVFFDEVDRLVVADFASSARTWLPPTNTVSYLNRAAKGCSWRAEALTYVRRCAESGTIAPLPNLPFD